MKDRRVGQLIKLRNEIQALEWSLVRLRTGKKAIRDTQEAQERIVQRIMEKRKHGQRVLASF